MHEETNAIAAASGDTRRQEGTEEGRLLAGLRAALAEAETALVTMGAERGDLAGDAETAATPDVRAVRALERVGMLAKALIWRIRPDEMARELDVPDTVAAEIRDELEHAGLTGSRSDWEDDVRMAERSWTDRTAGTPGERQR